MKTIPTDLATHLAGTAQTIAILWKMTRVDGQVFGFTDHDRDITYDGLTYDAKTGITRSATHVSSTMAVDNAQIESVVNSEKIDPDDIRANKWDGCKVDIYLVNYANISNGAVHLKSGLLGQIELTHPTFTAEFLGLSQKAAATCVDCYSPDCRAEFGGDQCGVTVMPNTGHVLTVTSNTRIIVSIVGSPPVDGDHYFLGGLITFTSGLNAGFCVEVQDSMPVAGPGGAWEADLTLWLPLPNDVTIGDDFNITAGCDHTFATCKAKWDNVVNFRGEHLLPGLDQIVLYPDAQTSTGGGGGKG